MQIFYAPDIRSDKYTLDEKESKHSVRVLRMKKGAQVRLIDGKGNLYEGVITDPDPSGCSVEILKVINDFEKREYNLHIAISPLKNPERFEWFVGKSVEIGIDEITPLICRNTEKSGIKQERLNNLIISSMKQSLKARMSILNVPCLFSDFLKTEQQGILMIACCGSNIIRRGIGDVCKKGESAVILIGPEGDFSDDEIEEAAANGYIPVHLGPSRLRTETAGIAACHSVYFINQSK
jgi:16S rRNA (uracil1498-N3)-methyltransferase